MLAAGGHDLWHDVLKSGCLLGHEPLTECHNSHPRRVLANTLFAMQFIGVQKATQSNAEAFVLVILSGLIVLEIMLGQPPGLEQLFGYIMHARA